MAQQTPAQREQVGWGDRQGQHSWQPAPVCRWLPGAPGPVFVDPVVCAGRAPCHELLLVATVPSTHACGTSLCQACHLSLPHLLPVPPSAQVRQLQPQAVAAWWQQGHPGWAIYPVDSEQFLATGTLDSAALPMPTEPLLGPMMGGVPSFGQPNSSEGGNVSSPPPALPGALPGAPPLPAAAAAAAAAAFNPAMASAFMGAAGGLPSEALLRAMSPFLHGAAGGKGWLFVVRNWRACASVGCLGVVYSHHGQRCCQHYWGGVRFPEALTLECAADCNRPLQAACHPNWPGWPATPACRPACRPPCPALPLAAAAAVVAAGGTAAPVTQPAPLRLPMRRSCQPTALAARQAPPRHLQQQAGACRRRHQWLGGHLSLPVQRRAAQLAAPQQRSAWLASVGCLEETCPACHSWRGWPTSPRSLRCAWLCL